MLKKNWLILMTCCLTAGCNWLGSFEVDSYPTHKLGLIDSDSIFNLHSPQFKHGFENKLNPVGEALQKETSDYMFRIQAYVDKFGTHNQQVELSKTQAELVASYLWSKYDIPLEQFIEITGMGSADPIADPNTPEGSAINRRIQVILQPK